MHQGGGGLQNKPPPANVTADLATAAATNKPAPPLSDAEKQAYMSSSFKIADIPETPPTAEFCS